MAKRLLRGRKKGAKRIVAKYAQMWPRAVFDIKEGKKLSPDLINLLKQPGVYVLYRDDHPYYVGKTKGSLFYRILAHANESGDRYYHFWNFFSAFVVPDKKHIDEIEGVLIAAFPTANNAVPQIERINLPKKVARILREQRVITIG